MCICADMAAINFSLMNFKDFTIFMPIFSHTFILVLLEYMYWISGSILFCYCGVLS